MKSLKGHLLVATPDLLDPNFAQTVLLMLEHTEAGAVGLVLNRPTEAKVTDVSEQILDESFEWDKVIGVGGPVDGPLMALLTDSELGDQEVCDGVFTTADATKIEQVIRGRVEPSLLVANYAGWGSGQLEREIAEGSWFSIPATSEHIFEVDAAELWEQVCREVRASARPLVEALGLKIIPPDPSLN